MSGFAPLHEPIFDLDACSSICSYAIGAFSHKCIFRVKNFLSCLLMVLTVIWLKFVEPVELLKIVQKSHCKSKTIWLIVHAVIKKRLTLYQLVYIALQDDLWSSWWFHMAVNKIAFKKKMKYQLVFIVLCPMSLGYVAEMLHFYAFWGSNINSTYFSELHPAWIVFCFCF